MKKLIFAFIILLLAVWLGFLIHRDPGYILITYQRWSIETSLWIGIVSLFIIFIIFYGVMRLFRHTSRLGTNLQLWNKERRERKSGEQTNKAFETLIEMQWSKAEDLFSKSAKDSTCPVINYSAAAYAAQQLSAFDRRNKHLAKLSKQVQSADKTSKLVESYFYIHSNQWKEALKTLRLLQTKYPNDPAVLRFLAKTFEALKDWDSVKGLLPQLARTCDDKEYEHLQGLVYTELLGKAIHPEWLDQVWQTVPKALRAQVDIAEAYAKKSIELHQENAAIPVIENAIKKNWQPRLVKVYGQLKGDHLAKQIHHAESWLKKHPDNFELLICLGSLCIDEKLWGKARDYLNSACAINASAEAYYQLGRLFEATNDAASAIEQYRKAASTH